MRQLDIIVSTSADFAVLRGGRPRAAGTWEDVARMRAYKRRESTSDPICIDVTLSDGTVIVVHEDLPGWDDFLETAEGELPTLRPARLWLPDLTEPDITDNGLLIFERSA